MPKFYAGVGSRETPVNMLRFMKKLAGKLEKDGWILRSGAARGADTAFEDGVDDPEMKEIFLAHHATFESMEIAKSTHPAWGKCGPYAKQLHGRNTMQILGEDLRTPVSFLVCWTKDGAICQKERSFITGGTGTAIAIAEKYKVPVYNLIRDSHFERIQKFCSL